MNRQQRTLIKLIGGLIVAALAVVAQRWTTRPNDASRTDGRTPHAEGERVPRAAPETYDLAEAIRARREGALVESSGIIVKVLADDEDGERHQRFLVRLSGGETVLIAHNIDIGRRAPVRARDPIAFRGQFEWNDRGGVVHWTHHDPRGNHADGWLRHEGTLYE